MQEYHYTFYEEPCRFDHFEDTKAVADAHPHCGRRWRARVQRVRLPLDDRAAASTLSSPTCTIMADSFAHCGSPRWPTRPVFVHAAYVRLGPGLSRRGDLLRAFHNPVPFTEFKGDTDIPVSSDTSSLKCENGMVRVPSGPGFGITIDPAFIRKAVKVTILN